MLLQFFIVILSIVRPRSNSKTFYENRFLSLNVSALYSFLRILFSKQDAKQMNGTNRNVPGPRNSTNGNVQDRYVGKISNSNCMLHFVNFIFYVFWCYSNSEVSIFLFVGKIVNFYIFSYFRILGEGDAKNFQEGVYDSVKVSELFKIYFWSEYLHLIQHRYFTQLRESGFLFMCINIMLN